MTASGRSFSIDAKAASNSSLLLILTGLMVVPVASPPSFICSRKGLEKGSVALARAVTRRARGSISRISCTLLPASSAVAEAIPVTFPPGRGRLATSPVPTGSPVSAMTIGISSVACFAACHCRKLNPASKRSRIGRCSWLMRDVCSLIWLALIGLFRSRASLQAEILTLRHQLNVLRRKSPQRLTFTSIDRLVFAGLYRLAPGVLDALKIVRPETVIRWHRAGFRAYWRWKSRPRSGRPKTSLEIRHLVREMSLANPLWGAPRLHGELLKLGIDVGQTTRCEVYGAGKATAVPRVEDVPS